MAGSPVPRREFIKSMGLASAGLALPAWAKNPRPAMNPNIVLIYADDLGYGDVGCYGATKIATPNIDKLARDGIRFTNAHSTAATCTPSRYSLLTGEYAWRKKGTGILPGDARLIIEPGRTTLASLLKEAGYATGAVGKWHLGLGGADLDWNGEIAPGPLDIGFDACFIIPATGDRVPCVFVENRRIAGLDPADPIRVGYEKPVGSDPTGRDHPGLLKIRPSHGHDQTIVNGISRIGYMSGGKAARWVDEDIADILTAKAVAFVEKHRDRPFFLYFATHDIHVPRVPHSRFAGKSGFGPRGDVILQLDECVGEIVRTLSRLGLSEKTIVIFTSDNGPVVDDGYRDEAVEKLGGHKPAGPLRGGKYSAFDAGTRVPFIVRGPKGGGRGESKALFSQIDLLASFAAMTGRALRPDDAPDSFAVLGSLFRKEGEGRDHLVEQAGVLSLIRGRWKYIEPGPGPKYDKSTDIELGRDSVHQLFDLDADIGERVNLAESRPEIVKAMAAELDRIRSAGRTRTR